LRWYRTRVEPPQTQRLKIVMKRTRLLNSELSYAVSRIGHTASITLCDAGLPIPSGVKRIDLAIERGYPSFIRTLDVLLSEMFVEEIVIASEIEANSPEILQEMMEVFRAHEMEPTVTQMGVTGVPPGGNA